MNAGAIGSQRETFSVLRALAQGGGNVERCEFCSSALARQHRHLLELATRKIICACDPCALRFENVVGRWKLIPRDTRVLADFRLEDAQWDALALPINLAFLLRRTPQNKVAALYPSPAGATESLLTLESWETLVRDNPVLGQMQPDVEALLVNRMGDAREYYLAPIDACYELAGLIRLHWRGLSGGEKVRQEMQQFFARLRGEPQGPEAQLEAAHA